jgi:hypothetical protein
VAGGRWPAASGDGDFAGYLADRPAASIELFWRFVELACGCGPAELDSKFARWLSEAREVGDGVAGPAGEG